MIAKLKLAPRVVLAFLALETIPLLVGAASWLMRASNSLHRAACHNLVGVKTLKHMA